MNEVTRKQVATFKQFLCIKYVYYSYSVGSVPTAVFLVLYILHLYFVHCRFTESENQGILKCTQNLHTHCTMGTTCLQTYNFTRLMYSQSHMYNVRKV